MYTARTVTPRKRYTFFIDLEQQAELTKVKVRDGISESEQIRRAIAMWLETKGVTKSAPRRASTRRKA
jgi:hypothetical protein